MVEVKCQDLITRSQEVIITAKLLKETRLIRRLDMQEMLEVIY